MIGPICVTNSVIMVTISEKYKDGPRDGTDLLYVVPGHGFQTPVVRHNDGAGIQTTASGENQITDRASGSARKPQITPHVVLIAI